MKICQDCLQSFDDYQEQDYDPARELGDIFLKSTGTISDENICHECRKKLGMLNMMGFFP